MLAGLSDVESDMKRGGHYKQDVNRADCARIQEINWTSEGFFGNNSNDRKRCKFNFKKNGSAFN